MQRIRKANKVAYNRNLVTDTILVNCGDLDDAITFCNLWSIV